MATDTSAPFESERSMDSGDQEGLHTGALAAALRDSVSSWGVTLLMVVFTGISLYASVYTSIIYPAFFGLCTAISAVIALGQTYSRYGHHHFEMTHGFSQQRNA